MQKNSRSCRRQQNRRQVMLDATEQKAGHVRDSRTEDRGQETAEQKTGGKRQQNRRLVMQGATEQNAGHVGDIRTEDRSCKVQQNRRQVM